MSNSMNQDVFRNVVGHFASGVTVITTQDGPDLFGTTASAVSSLSMDPPMMLVCLNTSSSTHDHVAAAGRYAINILAVDQGEIASHFARKGADKFATVSHSVSDSGLPLIDGVLATIECRVVETASGGTHTVFLGEVIDAQARPGEPLAYFRGQFGSLEPSNEAAAYDRVRSAVLRRHTPIGQEISVDELSDHTGSAPTFVYNALVRLATEDLVTRTAAGGFAPTPVSAAMIDNLYGARESIESGVIEQYLADAPEETIAEIVRIAQDLVSRKPETSEELDAFLAANLNLHCTIVGLAGSRQLVSQFRQLSISTVWRDTYQAEVWQDKLGHPLIPELVAAITVRDAENASRIVREQVRFVKKATKHLIEQHGGAL
ncbi:flavin reductase [Microbacterium sp. LRZ72]|uniref:flavin reductase n=1 Tax=Microbacterium sp. LRZ72 TaxID=2942481 RepID=UPI0029A315A8|nr:flavin reductase [Microbacterium sp. LRZ72]MDX2376363.1 flavin reductase [Microbacterium sp. LRZ72]